MEANALAKAVQDIQDTLIVMARIEKLQSEHLSDLLEFRNRVTVNLNELAEFRRHTEENLSEITDKLNALIDIVSSQSGGPK